MLLLNKKQKVKKIVVYSVLFFNMGIIAQNKIISGIVKDAETKQPIAFGSIGLIGNYIRINTNADGKFTIEIPNNITTKKVEIILIINPVLSKF